MIRAFIIISLTLFVHFSECNAGRVSYSLCRLDAQADEEETPYNRRSTCGLNGTRLVIKYEIANQHNQYNDLWAAEIKYLPKNVLTRAAAPKIFTEDSVVTLNYYLYGANTLNRAKRLYLSHYTNLPQNYNFPSMIGNGNFQYHCNLGTSGFTRLAANTELFRWERMDNNNTIDIQQIITDIQSLQTLNNGNDFPRYCAKGYNMGPFSEDVLNCITFDMRLLDKFGFPVAQESFINQYLSNTAGMKFIAYPERFLEPLVRVCSNHTGFVNFVNREHISSYYNNEYYSNAALKALLQHQPPPYPVANPQFQHGQMWIIGNPSADIRPPVNTSTLLGESVVGGVGGVAGYIGATTVVTGTGTTAMLVATTTTINGVVASGATSLGLLSAGATLPAVITVAAPVIVLGGIGIGVGYVGVRVGKKIMNWF